MNIESINIVNGINININNNNNFLIVKDEDKYNNKEKENLYLENEIIGIEDDKLQIVNLISFSFPLSNGKLFDDNDNSKNNSELLKVRRINKSNKILSIKKQPMGYKEIAKTIKNYIDNANNNISYNEAPKNNMRNRNKTLKINNINFSIISNNNFSTNDNVNSNTVNIQITNSRESNENISINNSENNQKTQNIIFNNTFIKNTEFNNIIHKTNYNKCHDRKFSSNSNNSISNYDGNYKGINQIDENVNKSIISAPEINIDHNFQKNENINVNSINNSNTKSCNNTPRTNSNNYINSRSIFESSNDNIENYQKNDILSEREVDENVYNEVIQGHFEYNEKNDVESYHEKNISNNNYYNQNNIIINNQNNDLEVIENTDNNINYNYINYNNTNYNNTNYNNSKYINLNEINNYHNNSQISQSEKIYNESKIIESPRDEIIMPAQKINSSSQLITQEIPQLSKSTSIIEPITSEISSIQQAINEDKEKAHITKLKNIKKIPFFDFQINKNIEESEKEIRHSTQIPDLTQIKKMPTMTQIPIQTKIFLNQSINLINSEISKNLKSIEFSNHLRMTPVPKKNRTKKFLKSPYKQKKSYSFETTQTDDELSELPIFHKLNNPINTEIPKMSQTIEIPQINKMIKIPQIPEISEITLIPQTPQTSKKIPITNFDNENEFSQISQIIPIPQTNQFTNTLQIIPEMQTNKILKKIYPIQQNTQIQNQQNICIPQTQITNPLSQKRTIRKTTSQNIIMNNLRKNTQNSLSVDETKDIKNNNIVNLNNMEMISNMSQISPLQPIIINNLNNYNNNIISFDNNNNNIYHVNNSNKNLSNVKKCNRRTWSFGTEKFNNISENNYNHDNLNPQPLITHKNIKMIKTDLNMKNSNINNNLFYCKNNNSNKKNYPRYNYIVNNNQNSRSIYNYNISRKLENKYRLIKKSIYNRNFNNFITYRNNIIYSPCNAYNHGINKGKIINRFYGKRPRIGIPIPYRNQMIILNFNSNTFIVPNRRLYYKNKANSNMLS